MKHEEEYNFVTPEQYIKQIDTSLVNLDTILNEFKKLFVINKMHPNNEEYQIQYENIISNINQISSNLFIISNDIENSINLLNQYLTKLNKSIHKERNANKELKKKLGIVEDKHNSTTIMFDDYKELYDKYYLKNWSIGLSILFYIYTISLIYKK